MPDLPDWYPLESSPEVFTSMARVSLPNVLLQRKCHTYDHKKWGLADDYQFVDVLGLDEELLSLVPQPVLAVILLFPDTPEIVHKRSEEGPSMNVSPASEPLWIPQVGVGHSCGTFAMIHAFAQLNLTPGLSDFFASCRQVSPEERTRLFAEHPLIRSVHNAHAAAGQTLVRDSDWDDCDHFLSFVQYRTPQGARLAELDGNAPRTGPLDRGRSRDLLRDVATVVKKVYLPHAKGNDHFSIMALVKRHGNDKTANC